MSSLAKIAVALVCVAGSTALAAPVTVNFSRITANASQNVASQFSCEIDLFQAATQSTAEVVSFTFRNNVGIQSSISEIYFMDGTLLGVASLVQNGTSFVVGSPSPGNLPSGNNVNFLATQSFSADAQGNPSVGIDTASDYFTMRFNLINNKTFADTINMLGDGSLRIGLHVRAIGQGGESDSFTNNNPPTVVIPLPGAAGMGLASMIGLATIRRRRTA